MSNIAVIIESRMTSSRLPGKVMKSCLGKSMTEHMIERVRRAKTPTQIIIACTDNDADDVIAHEAARLGVKCHRGSEENVMLRVLEAAQSNDVDIIVEVTGDCPLIDPDMIDDAVMVFQDSSVDYLSNLSDEDYAAGRCHPLGYGVQVFSTKTLADSYGRTNDPLDYEHVSRYFYTNPDRYRIKYLTAPEQEWGPGLSVTLDTADDFAVICHVLEALYPDFSVTDVIAFLKDNPDIADLNRHNPEQTAQVSA